MTVLVSDLIVLAYSNGIVYLPKSNYPLVNKDSIIYIQKGWSGSNYTSNSLIWWLNQVLDHINSTSLTIISL